MKRVLLFLMTTFALQLLPIWAQSGELETVLEMEMSLPLLSRLSPAELDNLIDSDKYVIVNGTVSSITEIERSDDNLILDLHLVSGRWIGLDKVEDYKCIVNISGKEWELRFPKRRPRVVTDEMIFQNYNLMVVGKVTSYVMENGTLKSVIDASYIRRIQ